MFIWLNFSECKGTTFFPFPQSIFIGIFAFWERLKP